MGPAKKALPLPPVVAPTINQIVKGERVARDLDLPAPTSEQKFSLADTLEKAFREREQNLMGAEAYGAMCARRLVEFTRDSDDPDVSMRAMNTVAKIVDGPVLAAAEKKQEHAPRIIVNIVSLGGVTVG